MMDERGLEQQYIDRINEVRGEIADGDLVKAEQQLNELYCYKPVRLLWFVAEAELRWKQGRLNEVFSRFDLVLGPVYDHPGVREYARFVENWMTSFHDVYGLKRNHALYSRLIGEDVYPYDTDSLRQAYDTYINEKTGDNLYRLMMEYLGNCDILVQQIIRYQLRRSGYLKEGKELWYYKTANFDYLEEKLYDPQCCFILVERSDNAEECDIVTSVLSDLGHSVYRLTEPVRSEDISVAASVDAIREMGNVTELPIMADEQGNSNVCELIAYLYDNRIREHYAILIADGTTWELCMSHPLIRKHAECLMDSETIVFAEKLYFGWVGDYRRYISDIYCHNVEEWIDQPRTCDFSIVIPARNAAGTLYYTLQTCLKQDYTGTYEIVVSDNSAGSNMQVYQVCADLDDPHIRYVKTPRNLSLTKSFEFAFLQARGEFILSIGADDGLCPWTLTVLKEVMTQYPDELVVQWERGYYGWSGFASGYEDRLVVPGRYERERVLVHYEDRIGYFAKVLKDPSWSYSLPNLYLNSGFRHEYLQVLLDKTGRLWDGCNQDLYMGVIGAAINEQILNIEYPLAIAGMSNQSMGYVIGKPNTVTIDAFDQAVKRSARMGDNVGIYVPNGIAKTGALVGADTTYSLYQNIMRAIQLGVLPDEWRGGLLDDKTMFLRITGEYSIVDDYLDRYIHYARFLAGQRGPEFLAWFDDTIYKKLMRPKYYKPQPEQAIKKTYREGPTEGGGLAVDASVYGVTNIAEAAELFVRFLDWTPEGWTKELKKREEG